MSNISIGHNDGFDTGNESRHSYENGYTSPGGVSWWVPLLASAVALGGLIVIASLMFGDVLSGVMSGL